MHIVEQSSPFYFLRCYLFKIRKVIWIISFKLTHHLSPWLIPTAFEHRRLVLHRLNPTLIIDAGFNKGQFSSFALETWKQSFVVSFDPSPIDPPSYARLLTSNYPNRFTFINKALSATAGECLFYFTKKQDSSSLRVPTPLNNRIFSETFLADSTSVSQTPYSSIKLPNHYDQSRVFLKIDVQGSELELLKGFSKQQLSTVHWIYIELTQLELYEGQSKLFEINQWLVSQNFSPVNVFNVQLNSLGQLIYGDFLYVKNPASNI